MPPQPRAKGSRVSKPGSTSGSLYLQRQNRYIGFNDANSNVSFNQFRNIQRVYRPGGVVKGQNVWRFERPPEETQSRGYIDPDTNLWVPLSDDPITGAPYTPPTTGGTTGAPGPTPTNVGPGVGADGTVYSPDEVTARNKYDQAVANARAEIIREREANGNTNPISAIDDRNIQAEAERRANRALNVFYGGNPNNAPLPSDPTVGPKDPSYVPQLKPGQFFPQYTGWDMPRRITDAEADALNFLATEGTSEASEAYKALTNPMVSAESKQQLMANVLEYQQSVAEQSAPAQENVLLSWWNPLTWGPRIAATTLLKGMEVLDWAYTDYVDPSLSWTASALPGGPRTATWEEAQSVSGGQMISQVLGPRLTASPLVGLGPTGTVKALFDPNYRQEIADFTERGYFLEDPNDIYVKARREAVFEGTDYGSTTSGTIGFAAALVWDPLLIAGPLTKGIRVSHRLGMGAGVIGPRGTQKAAAILNLGAVKYEGFDEARRLLDEARITGDPEIIANAQTRFDEARAIKNQEVRGFGKGTPALVRFADWILDPADGTQRTTREIMRHSVIKGMTNSAEFASALSKVKTYEDFSLIMRAAYNDDAAIRVLQARTDDLAREMAYLKVTTSADDVVTSVNDYQNTLAAAARQTSNALDEFRTLAGDVPGRELAAIDEELRQVTESLDALRSGRVIGVDQPAIDRLTSEMDRAVDIAQNAMFGPRVGLWSEESRQAFKRFVDAMEREKSVQYAEIGVTSMDEAAKARVATEVKRLEEQDAVFRLALEAQGGFRGMRVNFGIGNAQRLASWREVARQVKAERQARQLDSHYSGRLDRVRPDVNQLEKDAATATGGNLFAWVPQTFKAAVPSGEITVWGAAKGAKYVVADALTRPFTYAAAESPAGFITLKGYGGTESFREIVATLDNLAFYSDESMQAAKNNLIDSFIRWNIDDYTTGLDVITKLERQILADMANYYARKYNIGDPDGLLEELREVYRVFDYKRDSLIRSVKEGRYWVDEAGRTHASPVIESQLVDSMPLMDFGMAERLLDRRIARVRADARDLGVPKRAREYQRKIQDVETRLTKARLDEVKDRNTLETLPDEIPIESRNALRQKLKNTRQNVKALEKELKKAYNARDQVVAEGGGTAKAAQGILSVYDEFQTLWRANTLFRVGYPVRNTIDGLARRIAYEASIVPVMKDAVRGTKNLASNVATGRTLPVPGVTRRAEIRNKMAQAKLDEWQSSGEVPRKVRKWLTRETERLTDFRDNQRQLSDQATNYLAELRTRRAEMFDELTPAQRADLDGILYEVERTISQLDDAVADVNRKLASIDPAEVSKVDIINAYRQSLDRPRKVGQEMVQGVDGRTYWGARSDPVYGDIMEANASAGETVQATLGLNLSISRGLLRADDIMSGGVVGYGNINYWNAYTRVVNNQVRNSLVGRMWLAGEDPEEIAKALMSRGEGGKVGRYRQMLRNDARKKTKRMRDQNKSDKAYDKRASESGDRIDLSSQVKPKDLAVLATDADRSRYLLRFVDGAADVSDVPGKATLRVKPAEGVKPSVLADRIREQEWGMRVTVLKNGEVSVGLPKVTAGKREEVLDRARRLSEQREQQVADEFAGFSDGLEMIHDLNQINNIEDARIHVQYLINEFSRYIPSPELKVLLNRGPVTRGQIEDLYRGSQVDPPLQIHGSELYAVTGGGPGSWRNWVNDKVIQPGFKFLGTAPEDTLVRFPFMARRYEENVRIGSQYLAAAYPDGAPAWAVNAMLDQARKRALKDVNEYMYTQPRRTNFGRTFERFIPFISAWQNSVIAYGKLLSANPEMAMYFEKVYRAPNQLGLTDEDGNVRIPIPEPLVGKTMWVPLVGEVPITGVAGDEWIYRKESLMVLPQAVDPVMSFKAGPIIGMTASTLMQTGFASPVAPDFMKRWMDGLFGEGSAQAVWDAAMIATFGIDDFGVDDNYVRSAAFSDQPLGADMALNPAQQKMFQAFIGNLTGPEANIKYASTYLNIARVELLKWMNGERDEPTTDEIKGRANGLHAIRAASNLFGITGGPFGVITPPQQDFQFQELTELYRQIQDTYGYEQADEAFMDLFGDEVLMLTKTRVTSSVGPATTRAMSVAESYGDMIGVLAAREDSEVVESGMLNYILANGTETQADYNPSVRIAQTFRAIPNAGRNYRETTAPETAIVDSAINLGWSEYIKYKEGLQAEVDARGLSSIYSAGAEDLLNKRREWVENAYSDPLYADWAKVYDQGYQGRVATALDVIRTVTNNGDFMDRYGSKPVDMWLTAREWEAERKLFQSSYQNAEGNDYAQRVIKKQWADRSTAIARTNQRFQEFWIRYLDEDDLSKR